MFAGFVVLTNVRLFVSRINRENAAMSTTLTTREEAGHGIMTGVTDVGTTFLTVTPGCAVRPFPLASGR
jgi:hypothetical protein